VFFFIFNPSDDCHWLNLGRYIKARFMSHIVDRYKSVFVKDTTRAWGFHRLSINGMDPAADQPFHLKNCRLICYGEIYNYRKLIEEFSLENEYKSGSDCEFIVHLSLKIVIAEPIRRFDGFFGLVLHDYDSKEDCW